jgi:hypothetical protein
MTADRLEKIMSGLPVDCRVRVFVPGIGDLEITGVSTMGQIATVRPKVADIPIRSRRAMAEDARPTLSLAGALLIADSHAQIDDVLEYVALRVLAAAVRAAQIHTADQCSAHEVRSDSHD